MKEKETELVEQLRRIGRENTQKEKEVAKLKDEVYKVIIGQSKFSEELLTELINTKEKEINEQKERSLEIESKLEALRTSIDQQKVLSTDLTNWSERFEKQEMNEKKTMIINLINKITIFDEKIEVKYRLKFDNFEKNHYNNTDAQECEIFKISQNKCEKTTNDGSFYALDLHKGEQGRRYRYGRQ